MNLGSKILKILEQKGMSQAEFARRINTSAANANNIFKRNSIDSELLQKISDVLEYDFFNDKPKHSQMVSEPREQYITLSEQGKAKSNDYIESLKSVIDVIKHTLSTMESELRSKNNQIDFLQNRIIELEKKTK